MWWRRKHRESDLDEELHAYTETLADEYIAQGLSPEEARRRARIELGGAEQVKEEVRSVWYGAKFEMFWRDLCFGARMLRKSPGFTLIAVFTLALGIGANAAIFQLMDAVWLRSLPVKNPQQLAWIQIPNSDGWGVHERDKALSYALWEQIRDHQQAFSSVFAWAPTNDLWTGPNVDTRRLPGLWVSGEMFSALGVKPVRGRLFGRNDDRPGCAGSETVISYGFWQSEFGGRDSAIGSKQMMDGHPVQVIGVTPPGFTGLDITERFDFALPICALPVFDPTDAPYLMHQRNVLWLTVMGRLKPGMSLARASAELGALSPGLFEATAPTGYGATGLADYRKFRLAAFPARHGLNGMSKADDMVAWSLFAITGLVLLIACVNLANLMLARSSAREREAAVRLAIGASRTRIARQYFSESLLLAVIGALLGIVVSQFFSHGILWLLSTQGNPVQFDLAPDWRVFVFIAGVATFTCLLFGLLPVLRLSRSQPGAVMKAGQRGATASRERFSTQRTLVVMQIAISLVLLVAALLFIRSFRNLITLNPGFRERGILEAAFDLRKLNLPKERILLFQRELLDEIRAIPGVESAASTTNTLLDGGSWELGVRIGKAEEASKFTWVSSDFFKTMGIGLIKGRDFSARDIQNSPHVAIVNRTFVWRFLGNANPLGQIIRTTGEPNYPATEYQIIGVIKDTKYQDLRAPTPPMAFAPAEQDPNFGPAMFTVIHTSLPQSAIDGSIKERILKPHPEIGVELRPFWTAIQDGLVRERMMAALSGFFGALATLLAGIGLYGVISYVTARRRNEIGIRIALGATRAQVVTLVMRDVLLLVGIGLAIGAICSIFVTSAARALLFGLRPNDPFALLASAALLAAIASFAGFLPARRASRLDAMAALRDE